MATGLAPGTFEHDPVREPIGAKAHFQISIMFPGLKAGARNGIKFLGQSCIYYPKSCPAFDPGKKNRIRF
jgi:hypothetical protein